MAFEVIEGAMPELEWCQGKACFRSIRWIRDKWGWSEPEYDIRKPGDLLVWNMRTGRTWLLSAFDPVAPVDFGDGGE